MCLYFASLVNDNSIKNASAVHLPEIRTTQVHTAFDEIKIVQKTIQNLLLKTH